MSKLHITLLCLSVLPILSAIYVYVKGAAVSTEKSSHSAGVVYGIVSIVCQIGSVIILLCRG